MKKKFYAGHTPVGSLMTYLIHESFRLHGTLLAVGNRLTSDSGLTSARWQVLSSLAHADRPETVSYIARNMGLARQSIQRVADELQQDGLITFEPNPHHQRAPVLVLTAKGHAAFKAVVALQVPWVNALVKGIPAKDIETALTVITLVSERLRKARVLKKNKPTV